MHVHLISVEVSVVRGGNGQVQAESRIGKHLDSVTHQRHLMEGRLTIENDIIIVSQVTLNLVAGF